MHEEETKDGEVPWQQPSRKYGSAADNTRERGEREKSHVYVFKFIPHLLNLEGFPRRFTVVSHWLGQEKPWPGIILC